MAEQYISGDWVVRRGNEDEFVSRWVEFTGQAQKEAPGAQSFTLLRDMGDPGHFISFGAWSDLDSVKAWRSSPAFAANMARCRELCESFHAGDYAVVGMHP